MLMTSLEIALALGMTKEEAINRKLDLIALQSETVNYTAAIQRGSFTGPHGNELINQLVAYRQRRQLGRICHQKLYWEDGTMVPSSQYYVYYENILDPEEPKFWRLLFPNNRAGLPDEGFEYLLSGEVEFLHVKHEGNGRMYGQWDPRLHFSNWDDFPELHNYRVFAFDGYKNSHRSPVDQDPSRYCL